MRADQKGQINRDFKIVITRVESDQKTIIKYYHHRYKKNDFSSHYITLYLLLIFKS